MKRLLFIGLALCVATISVVRAETANLRVFFGTTPVSFVERDGRVYVSIADLAASHAILYRRDKATNTIVMSSAQAISSAGSAPALPDRAAVVTAMTAALEALGPLDASTSLGVSYNDYHSRLIDAKVAVQRNLDAATRASGKRAAPGYNEVFAALNHYVRADIDGTIISSFARSVPIPTSM
jgi:hypothetical protein